MNVRHPRLRPTLIIGLAAAVALAACGADTNEGASADSGSIFISGSSTVEPITTLVAEKFAEENPGFDYTVEGPGTGDGFALFCNGETDIADASRAIKDEEAQACSDAGIDYTEVLVAYDGLAVITSSTNEEVGCLSFADLYALLGPESQSFDTWSAANQLAAELPEGYGELHTPYPDAELVITAPGEESGTFDSFVEIVIEDIADARGQDPTTRPDYVASPNDNVIIEGVSAAAGSLGWVGLAFARDSAGVVKIIDIDGGDGCVAPSDETVVDGTYPIARPLYIYVNDARAAENPTLRAFVDFYLSDEGIASVGEVGYVGLSKDEVSESRSAWADR